MSNVCVHCRHSFCTKTALVYHQKTAKYCLKLRGEKTVFTCKVCDKQLSEKRVYEKHIEKCGSVESFREARKRIAVLEQQVIDKDKQISQLLNKLENVAIEASKKPTTTNILNLTPLTDNWLEESAKLLTVKHIENGAPGYAKFATENSFKDRVKCLDASRKILQYKDCDKVVKDQKGRKLANKFFGSIRTRNTELISEVLGEIKELLKDTERDDLESLMDKSRRLSLLDNGVKFNREKLQEEFVRELCVLLG